jgi:hypothetical protein
VPSDAALVCMQQLIQARHHVPSDSAAVRAAIDAKRGIISHAILLPSAQPLILKRGIPCHAMLHCMQYLIRARHHMPGDAAVTRAAIDSKRGITCQAMLPCMQQLIRARHHVPSDMLPPRVQPMIRNEAFERSSAAAMCAAIGSEARHPVPSDAALHAATDSSEAPTMCQVLPPCVQPLMRSEASRAKQRRCPVRSHRF